MNCYNQGNPCGYPTNMMPQSRCGCQKMGCSKCVGGCQSADCAMPGYGMQGSAMPGYGMQGCAMPGYGKQGCGMPGCGMPGSGTQCGGCGPNGCPRPQPVVAPTQVCVNRMVTPQEQPVIIPVERRTINQCCYYPKYYPVYQNTFYNQY